MPSVQQLDALRSSLEEERDQLRAQLDGHVQDSGDDENFADSGQVAAQQGETRALEMQLGEQLELVERALAKMDGGTYGTCEVCGKEIAEDRIEAMPATRFCIEHASG